MAKLDTDKTRGRVRPGVRDVMRIAGRLGLTGLIVAGAVLAVQFGASELSQRAEAAPTPDAAEIIPVSASRLSSESGYQIERVFMGQVEPQKTVAVSFELPGRLEVIAVEEGGWVKQGQIIAALNVSLLMSEKARLEASKSATEAQLKFARQTVERSEALTQQGFTSQAGLDEALARQDELLARIAEIDASLENVAIRIQKSQIRAPFEGRVTERLVDGGEALAAGQRVLSLVELHVPQVRIGVPVGLTEESLTEAQIEIAGMRYMGRLLTLRPDIDPVTRTRTAVFDVETDEKPAFGQIARLILMERIEAQGVWVPTLSLREGVRGQWSLLVVDPQQIVRSASVEILHATSDRVFVRGAFPEGTHLIDQGAHRVTVGQTVALNSSF